MASILVRDAVLADAPELGRVHVVAWQGAYVGIMPDEYLANLDPADNTEAWAGAIERNPNPTDGRRLVVELDGQVVGLSLVWPARGEDEAGLGELIMINLVPEAWGTGAGTALLVADVDALRDLGFNEAILWVAEDNARARRFYEREGWTPDGASKTEHIGGAQLAELRYRRPLLGTTR